MTDQHQGRCCCLCTLLASACGRAARNTVVACVLPSTLPAAQRSTRAIMSSGSPEVRGSSSTSSSSRALRGCEAPAHQQQQLTAGELLALCESTLTSFNPAAQTLDGHLDAVIAERPQHENVMHSSACTAGSAGRCSSSRQLSADDACFVREVGCRRQQAGRRHAPSTCCADLSCTPLSWGGGTRRWCMACCAGPSSWAHSWHPCTTSTGSSGGGRARMQATGCVACVPRPACGCRPASRWRRAADVRVLGTPACSGSVHRCDGPKYRVLAYLAAFRLRDLTWPCFRCALGRAGSSAVPAVPACGGHFSELVAGMCNAHCRRRGRRLPEACGVCSRDAVRAQAAGGVAGRPKDGGAAGAPVLGGRAGGRLQAGLAA